MFDIGLDPTSKTYNIGLHFDTRSTIRRIVISLLCTYFTPSCIYPVICLLKFYNLVAKILPQVDSFGFVQTFISIRVKL